MNPKSSGLKILGPKFQGFAENDLIHLDRQGETPGWIGEGLRRSMLNFLEGRGLDMDVRQWFDHPTPRPRVSAAWTSRALEGRHGRDDARTERRLVWLGRPPVFEFRPRCARLYIPGRQHEIALSVPSEEAGWVNDVLQASAVAKERDGSYPSWREMTRAFPGTAAELTRFMQHPSWKRIRSAGLLLV